MLARCPMSREICTLALPFSLSSSYPHPVPFLLYILSIVIPRFLTPPHLTTPNLTHATPKPVASVCLHVHFHTSHTFPRLHASVSLRLLYFRPSITSPPHLYHVTASSLTTDILSIFRPSRLLYIISDATPQPLLPSCT